MKTFLYSLLILSMFSCKENVEFDIYNYDGEYPRNMDGSEIKTYSPEHLGGEIEVNFNGHSWEHTPIISLNASENIQNPESKKMIEVSLDALMTNVQYEPCGLESFYFQVPLENGIKSLNEDNSDYITHFLSVNCDASKDYYGLNKEKPNWINITKFDSISRELHAEFDLNFTISERNSDFGPIYPKHVNFQGRIKTVIKKF